MSARRSAAVLFAVAMAAGAAGQDTDARCKHLGDLQDRGTLTVPTVLAALGDDDAAVAATAAAIVRHEWLALPSELLDPLLRTRSGTVLLREFAIAPRPAAAAWVSAWLADANGVSRDQHCLALAARGKPFSAPDGVFVFETFAAGEAGDGAHLAAALLPPDVADALLGRIHALLQKGEVDTGALVPLLDRLSPRGVQALLGLVVTLPAPVADQLAERLAVQAPELFAERVRAALDGEGPLELHWLRRAGKHLDRTSRIERVLALVINEAAPAAPRDAAFSALLDARCTDPRLLDWAESTASSDDGKVNQLLRSAIDELPEARLIAWLTGSPRRGAATAAMLGHRRELGGELERVLAERFVAAGTAIGPFAEAAAVALARRASVATVQRTWPQLRQSPRFGELVQALGQRREPAFADLLRKELTAAAPVALAAAVRARLLDEVRLQLALVGDDAQTAALSARAAQLEPVFVHRCAQVLPPLDEARATALLAAAEGADVEHAAELIGWAATSPSPNVQARLVGLATADRAPEILDVLFDALAKGVGRARLAAELRAAWAASPLPERLEPACFAVTNATASPPSADDLHLLAELVLQMPLADPERERQAAAAWPDGHSGFPLVQAVARALRSADPVAAGSAFADVIAAVRLSDRRRSLSRQRLSVLWQGLAAAPDVQRAVGAATGAFALSLPADPACGDGPAQWFALAGASNQADAVAARAFARAAIASLLRSPDQRAAARRFLGERDPGAGSDPWAALTAEPYRWEAVVATDPAARAAAVAHVREFAGYDAATRAWCESFEEAK